MSTLIEVCRSLRVEAERANDPEKYELAAAHFEQAGMVLSASRCHDRAKHYREVDVTAETQPAEPARELVFA